MQSEPAPNRLETITAAEADTLAQQAEALRSAEAGAFSGVHIALAVLCVLLIADGYLLRARRDYALWHARNRFGGKLGPWLWNKLLGDEGHADFLQQTSAPFEIVLGVLGLGMLLLATFG